MGFAASPRPKDVLIFPQGCQTRGFTGEPCGGRTHDTRIKSCVTGVLPRPARYVSVPMF